MSSVSAMTEQIALYGDIEEISVNEAAKKANVSNATIRNWIKTKYLKQKDNGAISVKSFDQFLVNVAGTEKLNSRANKSLKDEHNHSKLTKDILLKLRTNNTEIEKLGEEYQSSLSNSYRNKEGIYYTPLYIVKDLLKDISRSEKSYLTFCDPSCGSGNFIIKALDMGFKPENVFGFDVDPLAVEITKNRIFKKTGFKTQNIIVTDFLDESLKPTRKKFNYIFTNPPWGKKISKDKKEYFANILNNKCVDTCALFFFASLKCLKENGVLGFLLPESFFNISVFEPARKTVLDLKIERIVDYGKVFNGLVTKAQAIVVRNIKNSDDNSLVECSYKNKSYLRSITSFKKLPKLIYNFYCSDKDADVIEHIFSFPHITLKNNAKWGLGIVTGNNSKYRSSNMKEDYMAVYRGADITKHGLKKPTSFIPKDISLYQQVAPKKLYESKEKLIYKFITSKLCFFCDTKKRYILNSANMLILKHNFPISGQQLSNLLNSDLLNWLFLKIFNTHKVLRSDLETLPIHLEYFKIHNNFDEIEFLNYLKLQKVTDGTYRIKK